MNICENFLDFYCVPLITKKKYKLYDQICQIVEILSIETVLKLLGYIISSKFNVLLLVHYLTKNYENNAVKFTSFVFLKISLFSGNLKNYLRFMSYEKSIIFDIKYYE